MANPYRRRFTTSRTGVMKDNSMRYPDSKRDCAPCPQAALLPQSTGTKDPKIAARSNKGHHAKSAE